MGVNAQGGYFTEPCDCRLFGSDHDKEADTNAEVVPVPLAFSAQLHEIMTQCLPLNYPLSLLLLHVTQWEQTTIAIADGISPLRQRFHAPPGVLEQILTNMRRVIRVRDRLLVHVDIAAALILPYVDEKGIKSIHDRVYHSISLLQAETVIPPLRHEVTIELGISTSHSTAESAEEMLRRAGHLLSRISLTPVVPVSPWREDVEDEELPTPSVAPLRIVEPRRALTRYVGERMQAPFMHLPGRLPERLTHLIPHPVASSLRCVPVGRNHNRLTVAMANPGDTLALSQLAEITGMTIFPVACEEDALDQLLEREW